MKTVTILFAILILTLPAIAQTSNRYTEKINKPLAREFVQIELTDVDGGKLRFDDFRGKVILINLWGIWCGPCRDQLPDLVGVQNKYDRRDFEIIGVNIGDLNGDPEKDREIKVFADRTKLNFYLVQGTIRFIKELYDLTGYQVVPQSILLDRQGFLRGVFIGGGQRVDDEMKATVDRIVNNLPEVSQSPKPTPIFDPTKK